MASSRRRFLTTLSSAAAGGAASLGGRASAWSGPTARTVTVTRCQGRPRATASSSTARSRGG